MLAEVTSTREGGPFPQPVRAQKLVPSHSRQSTQFALASSAASRRPIIAISTLDAVVALERSSGIAAAAARAVAVPHDTPYRHPSLCCSCHPSSSRTAIDATPVCRERARMRKKWRVGCVARTAVDLDHSFAAAAPAALVAWPKSIDVPLSGPKRQNSPEKGRARSRRGAGGRQTLPTP